MKHLKIYETFDEEYKIGDCVIVLSYINYIDEEVMIILEDNDFDIYAKKNYTCNFLNKGNHKYSNIKIYSDEILRKATPEDIEISNMSIITNKFNL